MSDCPIRSILVLIDPEAPTRAALERAAELGRRCGARLTLGVALPEVAWYSRLLPGADDARESLAGRLSARLEALAAPLRQAGLAVEARVLAGRPYEAAAAAVGGSGHDLLLKDADPNPAEMFTSADLQLLRAVPCPVWLVRPAPGDPGHSAPLQCVLAAVDPAPPPDEADDALGLRAGADRTALNGAILKLAGFVAELTGAELHVVNAWDVPGESLLRSEALLGREQVDAYIEAVRGDQRRALDELLAAHPGLVEPDRVHFARGVAADVVEEIARRLDAHLVVMGTVVRTGLSGLLLGNTAETVLQRVPGSVLALKPPAREPAVVVVE